LNVPRQELLVLKSHLLHLLEPLILLMVLLKTLELLQVLLLPHRPRASSGTERTEVRRRGRHRELVPRHCRLRRLHSAAASAVERAAAGHHPAAAATTAEVPMRRRRAVRVLQHCNLPPEVADQTDARVQHAGLVRLHRTPSALDLHAELAHKRVHALRPTALHFAVARLARFG
jgi:hypothetical protein